LSDTILDIVAQYASIGSSVQLTLSNQEKISGAIESIHSTIVVIRQTNGNIRLIKSNNLADFEILSEKYIENEKFAQPTIAAPKKKSENIVGELKTTENKKTNTINEEKVVDGKIENKNILNIALFKRNVHLEVVSPDFQIEDLSKDEKNEINRIKNKYEYALKIHEMSRIRQVIPELEEIAANAKHHKIYLLCGLFAELMDEHKKAEKFFQISLSLQNKQAAIMLARLAANSKEWDTAVSYLIHSFLGKKGDAVPVEELLLALGSCLYRMENKEVAGIGQIQSEIKAEPEKELHYTIVSFALQDKYHDASQKALNGHLSEASKLAIESPVFSPISSFQTKHNIISEQAKRKSLPSSGSIYGHISACYPERLYGFIISTSNVSYYFHYRDINDQNLSDDLYKNLSGQKIYFTSTPMTAGHKYAQAVNIRLIGTAASSSDATTTPIKRTGIIPLPSKDSIYSRAKLAGQAKDFGKATKLFQQVIDNNGEYSNSAIKDLAALLNRQDQSKEAINLLDKYKSRFDDIDSLNKMKASFYIKAGEYGNASLLLNIIMKKAYKKQDKLNWLRQLAYCQMMDGKIDKSLKLLHEAKQKHPNDLQLKDIVEKFESIKLTGSPGEIGELQGLAGISSGLSLFSQHLIKKCDFPGADERAKARGFFSKRDFKQVENLFDRIDGRRPKEKANLLITLAAMTEKSPEAAMDRKTLQFLGRTFAFMGEAATYEETEKDSVRFYLAEAMKLGAKQDRFELRFPLSFFLSSYLSTTPSPGELLTGHQYDVERIVHKLNSDKTAAEKFARDFPYFDLVSPPAMDLLISIIKKERSQILPLNILESRDSSRQSMRDLLRTETTTILTLTSQRFTTQAIFRETAEKLFEVADQTGFELDRQRIISLANIMIDGGRYWEENDYVEKESKCNRLITGLNNFIDDIEIKPTKLSFELLTPLAEVMNRTVTENFEKYSKDTKPALELVNILSNDYYIPDNQGIITLRLELQSKVGGAPIEGVEILVNEEDGLKLIKPAYSPEILKGGQRREVKLQLKPSSGQLTQQAFSIRCYVSYKNRSGQAENSGHFSFPIRLGTQAEFVTINNPYQNYSGGRSVEDPNMFKGREEVIRRIIEVVGNGPVGQCFVLYGQKRSGKTSILNQLKLRLPDNCISISLSLGEVDINHEEKKMNFIELCIEKLDEYLEDKFDYIPEKFPSRNDIKNEPNSALRRALKETIKAVKNTGKDNPRIVLLIDEFTYVYEYIVEGSVSPDFMRSWKALLQMQLFSAVVVGQDSMPIFKQAFPNEFGVTYDKRISYLSRQEATRLSSEPIFLDGRSRYRGNAQDRLFELTAGSPFYSNIICDRLVNFLNFRHAPFITEADIESVLFGWRGGENEISGLIVGSEVLPLERFDPLITAAGESVAQNTRETYLQVLVAIAKSTGKKALLSDLPQFDQINSILKDMHEREIISIDAAKRYSIRVGLFAEWLSINDIFSGIEEDISNE